MLVAAIGVHHPDAPRSGLITVILTIAQEDDMLSIWAPGGRHIAGQLVNQRHLRMRQRDLAGAIVVDGKNLPVRALARLIDNPATIRLPIWVLHIVLTKD